MPAGRAGADCGLRSERVGRLAPRGGLDLEPNDYTEEWGREEGKKAVSRKFIFTLQIPTFFPSDIFFFNGKL